MASPTGSNENDRQDQIEELLVVIEEMEEALLVQDEELGLKDEEITELRDQIKTLEDNLHKARLSLRDIEQRAIRETSAVVQGAVEQRDAAIVALQAENSRLRLEMERQEDQFSKQLVKAMIHDIRAPSSSTYSLEGPETSGNVRRAMPTENMRSRRVEEREVDTEAFAFVPRTIAPVETKERLLAKRLQHTRSLGARAEAWTGDEREVPAENRPLQKQIQARRSASSVNVKAKVHVDSSQGDDEFPDDQSQLEFSNLSFLHR